MSETPNSPARLGRKMRVLLILSLGLNFLVIGAVAGVGAKIWRDGPPAQRAEAAAPPFVRALDSRDRRAVGRAIREAYRTGGIDRAGDRKGYDAAVAILRADPFDEAAMRALMARQAAASTTRFTMAQEAWLGHVLAMDADTRRSYAKRLADVLDRKHHRDKSKKDARPKD